MGFRAALRRLVPHSPGPVRVGAPAELLEVLRLGPAPLADGRPVGPPAGGLAVAVVVPPFRRGSGGHGTIAHLVRGLEARGHSCSLWIVDDEGRHAAESESTTADRFRTFFGPTRAPIRKGFSAWEGADVVMATGWQTVPAVLRRPGAGARAYLVQDHEPEFYATSAERQWASWTYRQGLHCIAASPWLVDLLGERYGASASIFDLAVDHDLYRMPSEPRRDDLVLFYARAATPRRGVALGLLALEELRRRRPTVAVALFGEARPIATRFPHTDLGTLAPERLARAYSAATVGLVLSLTNPSLIPQEMMACGLPCVDVASDAMLATFGREAPIELAAPDPLSIADALESMLNDADVRAERSRAGVAFALKRTWDAAAAQLEQGLAEALLRRRGPA